MFIKYPLCPWHCYRHGSEQKFLPSLYLRNRGGAQKTDKNMKDKQVVRYIRRQFKC